MAKTLLLTNIPAPYREKVHEIVNAHFDNDYHVIYCNSIEPNREWKFQFGNYDKTILKSKIIIYKNAFIHINTGIIKELRSSNPEVVITNGFGPTMLTAFIWSKFKKRRHIVFIDGTLKSEQKLSLVHKVVRKFVFPFTDAFIGASKQGFELFKSYGIEEKRIFISCLCIDNSYFKTFINSEKKYDIIFSGQFTERKMPLFFVEVAKKIYEKRGQCKVLLVGSGPLKEKILKLLDKYKLEYDYPGFIQQKDLPIYYASARILVFPTMNDPWGVVANEACAVRVPVITCENAGVANDLIVHNYNGYVLPLKEEIWADHVIKLLENKELYNTFSENAYNSVQKYNYQNAAEGIINAVEFVSKKTFT